MAQPSLPPAWSILPPASSGLPPACLPHDAYRPFLLVRHGLRLVRWPSKKYPSQIHYVQPSACRRSDLKLRVAYVIVQNYRIKTTFVSALTFPFSRFHVLWIFSFEDSILR